MYGIVMAIAISHDVKPYEEMTDNSKLRTQQNFYFVAFDDPITRLPLQFHFILS